MDGDGAPDAVVQVVQLFSSTGRPPVARRAPPCPRTLHEGVQAAPVHDPAGLSVEDGQIVAAMTAYGPDDSHASGPPVPITVRWRFDGQQFLRAAP